MIYTLTINPAIDMNITADDLLLGKVNRTRNAYYSPNGKGINVSFILKHFNVNSEIIGFFGGFSGEYIVNSCKEKGFTVHPISIEETTRINVFIEVCHSECKLVNKGPHVGISEQEELLELLSKLEDMEMLIISGSLADGIDDLFYEKIMGICKTKKTGVILDISSPRLNDLLSYCPYLIKPNDEEIKNIFGWSVIDEASAVETLKKLYEMGAQNILLTLGDKGSYFYNGKEMYFCEAYPVKLKSSACSGDAYLGAFLSEWLAEPNNIVSSLKLASAAGANVAESNGLGDLKNVMKYKEKITVRKIL